MTSHDEMPTRFPALVWAVIFTILLVAAVAIFALGPYPLEREAAMAAFAKPRIPGHSNSCRAAHTC